MNTTPSFEKTNETICAIATAPGRGGIGIIRLSGTSSLYIASKILRTSLKPRYAYYGNFYSCQNSKNNKEQEVTALDKKKEVIDAGIALYFPNPHSFTGEDVVELQAHGGPIVLDMLLSEITQMGARLARPGEFSERAFLNDKLDLAQAEAIADLINASSVQAAKQAVNSLQGEFSGLINQLVEKTIHLRMYVESAIDFPEEEIDFLSDGHVGNQLREVIKQTHEILHRAEQGLLIKEGMKVVIAGRPNAGKSSLLNQLAQRDVAIVTDIAGTTRDVLKEHIHINGMPLHIIDTAGLRHEDDIDQADAVEKIGIERAWSEIDNADRILLIIDSTDPTQLDLTKHWPEFIHNERYRIKLTVIFNKVDRSDCLLLQDYNNSFVSGFEQQQSFYQMTMSALNGQGIDKLKAHLSDSVGLDSTLEGGFSARRRHIHALENAKAQLEHGLYQLENFSAGELLAEDLRLSQEFLSEITGKFTADDLLGEIFSNFCIGK